MLENILKALIESLLELLPADKVKEALDKGLDKIENKVKESGNKIDDMIVLPLIKKLIREPFDIKDNDEPEKSTK